MGVLIFILAVIVIYGLYYAGAKLFILDKKATQKTHHYRSEAHRDNERYNKLVMKKFKGKLSQEETRELNMLILKRSGQVNNTLADQREAWLAEEERKEKEWLDNTQL